MRTEAEHREAMRLLDAGMSSVAASERLGIPSSTIRLWRRSPASRARPTGPGWRPLDDAAYCYVLGFYLGDGHLAAPRGSWFLRLFLDARHVAIGDEAVAALQALWPTARVGRSVRRDTHLTILQMAHPDLPFAFPQHGHGKKHTRPIALQRWQAEMTARHPRALLRGLVHSDGCRTVNRFSVRLPSGRVGRYAYPRYFFSNLSADIRRIFTDHCDLLGVRWTMSNSRNVSISHRDSVALLDSFIGPKT